MHLHAGWDQTMDPGSSIRITQVYGGEAGEKFIYLNRNTLLETKTASMKLTRGQAYLVLLRPSSKSIKSIRAGE